MNIIAKKRITTKQVNKLIELFPCSQGFKDSTEKGRKRWDYIIWNPFKNCIWIECEDLETYVDLYEIDLIFYNKFDNFIEAVKLQRLELML